MSKRQYNKIPVLNGHLITGGRPSLTHLREAKVPADVIVTLLKGTERGVLDVKAGAHAGGYRWKHLPMTAWSIMWERTDIQKECKLILEELQIGATVFVHCSAGIHRSSTVALNCMRLAGVPFLEAMKQMRKARPEIEHELMEVEV